MDELIYDNVASYLEKDDIDSLSLSNKDASELLSSVREKEDNLIECSREIAEKCDIDLQIYDYFLRKGSNKECLYPSDNAVLLYLKSSHDNNQWPARRGHVLERVESDEIVITFGDKGNNYVISSLYVETDYETADYEGDYWPDYTDISTTTTVYKNGNLIMEDDSKLYEYSDDEIRDFILDTTDVRVGEITSFERRLKHVRYTDYASH